jgi:UV DNA damage repair endonuclease
VCRDLVPMIHWNEAHGIRLFRLSSNIFPWMTSFAFEDLPHWPDIQKVGGASQIALCCGWVCLLQH